MQHQKPATSSALNGLPGYVADREFSDVDDLGEVAKGWGVDFRQLNRGGFNGRLRQAGFAGVQLSRFAADYRRHFGELPSQTARCEKI